MAQRKQVKKINCAEAEKRFNDLIDGYLKGQRKAELEFHIEHCRTCFGQVEFERKLKERVKNTESGNSPASLRKKIFQLFN
jgi:anti-sigma factor (TIGR02949 family)